MIFINNRLGDKKHYITKMKSFPQIPFTNGMCSLYYVLNFLSKPLTTLTLNTIFALKHPKSVDGVYVLKSIITPKRLSMY